ncbi:MAG: hypothetical protein ACFWTY_21520 [Shouchella clausii]|nr:hypothetical protein SAMN05192535_1264 [Shouchella rhizosphaerae]
MHVEYFTYWKKEPNLKRRHHDFADGEVPW